ncbi:MAG: hypothetical protein JWO77_2029, partial [Ilumatobacteraceae bacterium]|nr:hypothetical protein [Ilumatobacteraceae bacterium]
MSRPGVAARLAGAALAFGLVAIGVAPPVQAQSPDSLLTVRKLDGTDKDAVELTFLWTGDAEDLQNLTIREDGQAVKV